MEEFKQAESQSLIKPIKPLVPKQRVELILPEKDLALFQEMNEGYEMYRLSSKRHVDKSVESSMANVYDMVCTTGKPPWAWDEEDFDKWTFDIFANRRDGKEGPLAVSSQRKGQVSIKGYLDYIGRIRKFHNLVFDRYGTRLHQICHKDNMMAHVVEREMANPRLALTHDQVDLFFEALDDLIEEAMRYNGKDMYPLMRDKALFYTIYVFGLRISEARGIEVHHFTKNQKIPQFEEFGNLLVCGKGANGSGPRWDNVPLTDASFPPVMRWYLDDVRPHFQLKAHANEAAVFLTERGTRPTKANINLRFHLIREHAGIPRQGMVPHSLRHSNVSHESERFSLTTVQRKVRHKFASTTQGYTHLRDGLVDEEICRVVDMAREENAKSTGDGDTGTTEKCGKNEK